MRIALPWSARPRKIAVRNYAPALLPDSLAAPIMRVYGAFRRRAGPLYVVAAIDSEDAMLWKEAFRAVARFTARSPRARRPLVLCGKLPPTQRDASDVVVCRAACSLKKPLFASPSPSSR